MGRVRGGGKRRRLVMDDSSHSPQTAPASPSLPPGAHSSPPSQPLDPVIDPLAVMLQEAMDAPASTHPQGASSIRFPSAILRDPSCQGQSWPTSTAPAPPLSTDFAGNVDGRSDCHNGARGLPPAPSMLSNM
jgi:hypothetical protein